MEFLEDNVSSRVCLSVRGGGEYRVPGLNPNPTLYWTMFSPPACSGSSLGFASWGCSTLYDVDLTLQGRMQNAKRAVGILLKPHLVPGS